MILEIVDAGAPREGGGAVQADGGGDGARDGEATGRPEVEAETERGGRDLEGVTQGGRG